MNGNNLQTGEKERVIERCFRQETGHESIITFQVQNYQSFDLLESQIQGKGQQVKEAVWLGAKVKPY